MIRVAISVKITSKMKIRYRISVIGTIFSFAHLVFALWIYSQHYEGSWGYVPMVVVDFPVSLLFAAISHVFKLNSSWALFFIFGSAWWYLIGLWLTRFFNQRKAHTERRQ